MHTCTSSHGLKRSRRSCPRRVNAGNKNTPSTHHPRRRNVTTLMVGLKKRSHTQKSHPKVVNPRDIAGERKKNKTKTKQQQQQQQQQLTISRLSHSTASLAWWLRRAPRERKIRGFESRLRRDFSGSSHTNDFKIGTPVATLPGAWRYTVSAGTGGPGVSIL